MRNYIEEARLNELLAEPKPTPAERREIVKLRTRAIGYGNDSRIGSAGWRIADHLRVASSVPLIAPFDVPTYTGGLVL